MDVAWQPQWQAQWGGLDAGVYVPSQPATGVVTASMTHGLAAKQSGTKVEIHLACKYFSTLSLPLCLQA
jgi:ribosomal protein L35AE/L33A